MLSLSDTTIRMYRKKNGLVSFRLKSYLLIHTNIGFSLQAYLRNIACQLTLPSGSVIPLETTYTVHTQAEYELDTMIHLFWASGEHEIVPLRNSVGKLRVDYHISFTGHQYEKPEHFEMIVPLIVKSYKYKGL